MILRYVGEVALRERSPSGIGYTYKPGKTIEESLIPRHMIVSINEVGTGFILKRIDPVLVVAFQMYAVAFIVTAAHVVTDVIDYSENDSKLKKCKVDGYNENFKCFLIKSYHNKHSSDALGSNGVSYCVGEGDLALMILLAKSNQLSYNELNLGFGGSLIGNDCCIAGYPLGAYSNLMYNYPFSNNKDEALQTLSEIFNDTSKVIVTPGNIKWSGSIIEVSCSTCSGMSGSPLISNNSIIGVFVGGPTLKGQRELFKAAKELAHDNLIESWKSFHGFFNYQNLYQEDSDDKELCDLYSMMFVSEGLELPSELPSELPLHPGKFNYKELKHYAIENLISKIPSLIASIKDKNNITHNSALSIDNSAFQKIISDSEVLISRLLLHSEVTDLDLFAV